MAVSKNSGTLPKSSHLFIGFSIIFTIHFGGENLLFLVQHPYPMTDPWDERYIYLHGWFVFCGKLVGKCTACPMDPMGIYLGFVFQVIFDGFDPMVNHHEKPPFGRMCSTFSKHLKQIQASYTHVSNRSYISTSFTGVIASHLQLRNPFF